MVDLPNPYPVVDCPLVSSCLIQGYGPDLDGPLTHGAQGRRGHVGPAYQESPAGIKDWVNKSTFPNPRDKKRAVKACRVDAALRQGWTFRFPKVQL